MLLFLVDITVFTFREFRVSVNIQPVIDGPSHVSETAVAGNSVTLVCEVHAVPSATIRWMKDGNLVRSDEHVTLLSGGAKLQIGKCYSSS